MKKSLSLVVSSALVFSLFSSVAFAADATTTSTAPTTQEMMKDLGFSGTDHDYLDRASAAVSILKGLGIEVDNTATLSFTDVNASDAWAPYIATAAKLGIVHGVDGTHFQPFEKVSQQDYAIMLTLGYAAKTGQKVDTTATTDVNAADYAKPYIKAAIDLGLLDASTDWSATAGYDWMVKGAYNAKVATSKPAEPAKVSVASAKATGVQKVEVTLDKAVDDSKATLTLTRGTSSVTVDSTTWSDDKKTATLNLSSKLLAGDYTVTLGGLDADSIATASATFTAEAEKVSKIEFTSSSDQVAVSDKVKVPFRALNQYGEDASFSSGNYTAYASTADGSALVQKDTNTGKLYIVLDTKDASLVPNVAMITVNVYSEDSHVSANKVFKLGTQPYVAKVELGDVQYPNGKTYLSADGDKAIVPVTQYDQYGGIIDENSDAIAEATTNTAPYNKDMKTEFKDDNNDGTKEVVVSLTAKATVNGDYTVSVYGGSSVATATVSVKASKVPYKVQIGQVDGVFAVGDTDKYIPLVAYDADGNQLSAQDIADNAGLLTVNVSGNLTTGADSSVPSSIMSNDKIVTQGEHKGQIHIKSVDTKGMANVFVGLYNGTVNSTDSKMITVQDRRYPVSLKIDTAPATKAVAGGTSDWKMNVVDQYGENLDKDLTGVTYDQNNKTVTYDVYAKVSNNTGNAIQLDGTVFDIQAGGADVDHNTADISKITGETFTYKTAGAAPGDKLAVEFALRKINNADGSVIDDSVSTLTKEIDVIDPANVTLTYTVDDIDTLFAAKDNGIQTGDFDDATKSKQARTPSVKAKDSAGNDVAIPDYVYAVTSSDPNVVAIGSDNKAIIGNKAGTAKVGVNFKTANNELKTIYKDVTVKSDAISVASLSSDASVSLATANTVYSGEAAAIMNLDAKDQYNNEYKKDSITMNGATSSQIKAYAPILGITYAITDVKTYATSATAADNQVNLDTSDFQTLTVGKNVTSFTITATSPSGKTTTTSVITANHS